MINKIFAIINPISGYSRARELPLALEGRFRQEGFSLDIHITRFPGDAKSCAKKYGGNYDLVLISGGDGTISEVINGLADHSVPFTVVPSGTENLLAKQMRITYDIDKLVETIKWGEVRPMDLPMANGQGFLLVSGVGFDAQVLLHLNSFRTGNISHLTYFWPIWRTFWEYKFDPVTVEADGEVLIENRRGLVFVTNIPRYSVGLRIGKLSEYDDGLLDVCIYLCDDQIKLVGHAWRTIFRRHIEHSDVIYRQAKKINVSSPVELPYEVDGDPAGSLPVEYTIKPRALQVLLPPG